MSDHGFGREYIQASGAVVPQPRHQAFSGLGHHYSDLQLVEGGLKKSTSLGEFEDVALPASLVTLTPASFFAGLKGPD